MARCSLVPQDPDIDWRSQGKQRMTPIAAVVHDTIGVYSGPDSGDSQYIEDHELAHFVIGEDEGEWEQLFDTEVVVYHCNGANYRAFGVEFSRREAGMALTAWQVHAWGILAKWALIIHGIPLVYLNPERTPDASVWVNGGGFNGWISHTNVKTDDDSAQHVDWLRTTDWEAAIANAVPAPPPFEQRDEEDMIQVATTPDGTLHLFAVGTDSGVWSTQLKPGNPSYIGWFRIGGRDTVRAS